MAWLREVSHCCWRFGAAKETLAMTDPIPSLPRDSNGRFAPGGPGRPFGARSRYSRRMAQAILADFEANKDELLPRLRRWFLPQYVSLIGRLMPRGGDGDGPAELPSDAEAARLIAAARVALARIDAGQGTLADLEAALVGEGDMAPAAASETAAATDIIGRYR
jgi:hypothetical protein